MPTTSKPAAILMPTSQEDTAITAAARTDPDAQPLTPKQLKAMVPLARTMQPTLYYSPGACSLAPHIVLEEIGLPFSLSLVSTADGGTRAPAHLRLNPKGRVPVLVSGDSVLTEAPAILVHLALSHPGAALLADSQEGLVRSLEWFNWLSGSVHAVAVRQVWRPETFTRDAAYDSVIAKGKDNLTSAFGLIEERMKKSAWAVGDCYSIVDPYLLVFYRWGNRIGFDMRSLNETWTEHTLRVLERPAVARALSREEISVWH
jgi:glutathione S-transferase